MKKLYTFIFALVLTLVSMNARATLYIVTVGGATNTFSPSFLAASVGDVVNFTWASPSPGLHNVTGIAVPAGATPIAGANSNVAGNVYTYTILAAGTYVYGCTNHTTMTGGFSVGTGITDPTANYATNAYPIPCTDKITFKYNNIDKIALYNLLGDNVRTAEIGANEGKLEMNLTDLTAGIYFYRTYREGTLLETKKIVKSK